MRIEIEDERIILEGSTAVQTPTIRQIPGARFDRAPRSWSFPLSWATCVVARGVFGPELKVGPQLAEWAQREYTRVAAAVHAAREKDAPGNPDLYAYQRSLVVFLRWALSALVADDMGTGKTVGTIAWLEEDNLYPALIVAPNGVKDDWAAKFKVWAPERRVVVAGSGTETSKKAVAEVANGLADVLVVHWEALRSLSRLAPYGSLRLEECSDCDPRSKRRPDLCQKHDKALNLVAWNTVVADEAHHAKNAKADQTRALWALGDRADHRLALTGTPVDANAGELWSVMRFVAPQEYPAKSAWVDRYALTEPNFWSQGVNILGLRPDRRAEFDRYFLPRFIRRTKAEVLPFLPPKVYQRRDVQLTGKQLKAYRQLKEGMVAEIQGGLIMADNALVSGLRLRQLAAAYGSVTHTAGNNWDEQVRLTEPSSKLDELEEVLDELGDRQVVVWAESTQLINLAAARLADHGTTHVVYTGEQNDEEKARAKELFKSGQRRVFLGNMQAGGEGLDGLQCADVAVFLQRSWSRKTNLQAEDRLHRIGQQASSVLYIDIRTVDGKGQTIEDEVVRAVKAKQAIFQNVVRDKEDANA